MKEVEILVRVREDKQKMMERLSRFKSMGQMMIHDTYFYLPNENDTERVLVIPKIWRVRQGRETFLEVWISDLKNSI